ncbi:hypothetical protein [Candidatus Galacturonibacter soehngenii]|uniref:Uncharacterized protein n=1 Tax=Candidatus Galacturonatibacter soehngenii TaxID=2307010 RepID=A0A7V7QHS0_9FIRM|nr:hypothetical protein [Candidatus Galacturonibacter soehngenii]KAB1434548.1 hypothetical protein F7O84_18870 [Candidatus Galacturonibacter soehngenii]
MDFIMYSLKGSLSVICEVMIYWILFNGVFMRKKKRWINVIALFIYGFSILVISYVGRAGLPSTVKLIMVVFIGAVIARILFLYRKVLLRRTLDMKRARMEAGTTSKR